MKKLVRLSNFFKSKKQFFGFYLFDFYLTWQIFVKISSWIVTTFKHNMTLQSHKSLLIFSIRRFHSPLPLSFLKHLWISHRPHTIITTKPWNNHRPARSRQMNSLLRFCVLSKQLGIVFMSFFAFEFNIFLELLLTFFLPITCFVAISQNRATWRTWMEFHTKKSWFHKNADTEKNKSNFSKWIILEKLREIDVL